MSRTNSTTPLALFIPKKAQQLNVYCRAPVASKIVVHATGHPLLEQLDFERIIQRFVNQSEVDSTMCGRYARRGDKQKIAETFHVKDVPDFAMPDADYNIAPTTFQPIIRESRDTSEREMVLARWDLIPFFTKELSDIKGLSTINAKAETIATARTWREPFKKRRCLVPVSAFYEWHKKGDKKPYVIGLTNGSMFAFAGLWDAWKDKDGRWLQSYAIVTTAANELMAPFHDRMPVIMRPRDYDRWMQREVTEQPPTDLLRPFEADEMEMHPANPAVGNVRNNGPEMLTA